MWGYAAIVFVYLVICALMAAALYGAFYRGPRRRPDRPLRPFEPAPGEDC